jgi:hypothetical protein
MINLKNVHPLTLEPGGYRLVIEFMNGSTYKTHDKVKHPSAYVNAINKNKPIKVARFDGAIIFQRSTESNKSLPSESDYSNFIDSKAAPVIPQPKRPLR